MTTGDWILQLLLGGMLGVLGQGIRVVAGLKKVHDQAVFEKKEFSDLFKINRLFLSIFIGFIAGALAILALSEGKEAMRLDRQIVATFLGAGYAGTDFIEGFVKKNIPSIPPPTAGGTPGVTQSGTTAYK